MSCAIIGDSIAVGVSHYRRDCESHARSGISTRGWINRYRDIRLDQDLVVISLGSNDLINSPNVRSDMENIRSRIVDKRVIWIMPAIKPRIRDIVSDVAGAWGDDVILMGHLSRDGVHPTPAGYKEIAGKF